MGKKPIVVDGKGHLLGRLGSVVAKQLLNGESVVVVRCEGINVSGSLMRNKLRFLRFLQKRHLTNPKKGPLHHRSPSRMFWRVIRANLPYKTKRGLAALLRLRSYEGVPPPYDTTKRVCCPAGLRSLHLAPGRKFCDLGTLAAQVGWKRRMITGLLEKKRKEKSARWFRQTVEIRKLRRLAEAEVDKVLPKIHFGEKCKIGKL
eukprot:NODE_4502_length_799_cov_813.250667_g4163_i0.p1 GENE.NODE_4502_length_799_cov_813.250667_g4163_i0~~NODE_4502_length_799_cov_813.250667_g4163_i0.p1  ORF type:complete len:203 (+),score=33.59 NODE_4502_length_799_cov_813.250667_g4163_i0:69-677(+)